MREYVSECVGEWVDVLFICVRVQCACVCVCVCVFVFVFLLLNGDCSYG